MTALSFAEPEGERIEYKDARALENLQDIGREVVAFLNRDGGTIYIGVREENEKPVEVHGVNNPAKHRRRIEDSLASTIEPSWSPEVRITEDDSTGKILLLIECTPVPANRPYALLGKGNARHFYKRSGSRVDVMRREEVQDAFRCQVPSAERGQIEARTRLETFRKPFFDGVTYPDRFWMLITPTAVPDVDLKRIDVLFRDPAQSGNRASGFHVFAQHLEVRRKAEGVTLGNGGDWHLEYRGGALTFHAPLNVLFWKTALVRRPGREIWPFSVLEFPVSFTRLAAAIFATGQLANDAQILFDLGIIGARDWSLGPYEPNSMGYRTERFHRQLDGGEFVLQQPLRQPWQTFRGNPDRLAYEMVRLIYVEFGHNENAIPKQFDPTTGRLVFPE